ncbi:MAG: hypothetical protein M1543_01900, partial [Firmicutes bacterium]|nr:hypothetical protein [Bacillota bacterium]
SLSQSAEGVRKPKAQINRKGAGPGSRCRPEGETGRDDQRQEGWKVTEQSKARLSRFSACLGCTVFVLAALLFWLGLDFLKTEAFPHYFNAKNHVIVKQNPDTKEIYAWRDSRGNVYTAEDSQVKNFTWGITGLILFLMLFSTAVYNLSVRYYTKMLLEREPGRRESYVPRLQ